MKLQIILHEDRIEMSDIKGFEGVYAVTKDGKIWSYPKSHGHYISKGKFIKGDMSGRGYVCFRAKVKKVRGKTLFVHKLLADLHLPNPNNYKEVNHINGIKTDNRLENLEWCNRSQNMIHAYKLGLKKSTKGEASSMSKLTDRKVVKAKELHESGLSYKKIGKIYNVDSSTIRRAVIGENWSYLNI